MSNPTVDILMATYNGERYVAEQIESIQRQTYKDWRLLVSDDCSSDGTLGVVHSYARNDDRIQVVSDGVRHGGAKENFFSLMEHSTAPYFMFSDQDDVWLPEKVTSSLASIHELERQASSDEPLLVFSDMKVVGQDLSIIDDSFERLQGLCPNHLSFERCLAQAIGAGCTFLGNHSLLELASQCDDADAVIMHDWWVSIVGAALGRVGYCPEPLSLYRQHGDNEVGASKFKPSAWLGKLGDMVDRESLVARQAGCFLDSYCSKLSSDQKVACACLAGSMGKRGAQNALRLFAGGTWKVGSRKLGQLLASLRGGGVVAIVVTYKPDMQRLAENVDAIAPQVGAVLVYCNDASASPDLAEFLEARGCLYVSDAKNSGLSHALNCSCSAAHVLGARFALLLDQDSVAGTGLVSGLRSCMGDGVALASPQIVDRNKREGLVDDASVVPITRSITSGSLISLAAWESVGGFDEKLFVDWVDYEFSCDLRLHGYQLLRNNGVSILHEMGHREYAFTLPGPHGGRPFYRTNHPKGRLEDKARSWAITKRKYGFTWAGIQERCYIDALTIRDLALERDRRGTLEAFARGTAEGHAALKEGGESDIKVLRGDSPRVDILMATYNGGRYVAEQIASIERQTYENWRLLVSDDCSSDDTLPIIKLMAKDDDRIKVVSEGVRHGGAAGNFMSLLGCSDAPYVMFADQDDVWLPEKVAHLLAASQGMEECYGEKAPLLVFSDMRVVDDKLGTIAESFVQMARYDVTRLNFSQLLAQNVAAGCTMIANRQLIDLAARAPQDNRLIMHDWWLMLVAAAFGSISYLDERLSLYRQHGNNEVGANKFSPADRAAHQDFMEEQFRASLGQADLFLETYGSELDPNEQRCLREFSSIRTANSPISGLCRLAKSHCWKGGIRKLGQVAMVCRVTGSGAKSTPRGVQ